MQKENSSSLMAACLRSASTNQSRGFALDFQWEGRGWVLILNYPITQLPNSSYLVPLSFWLLHDFPV